MKIEWVQVGLGACVILSPWMFGSGMHTVLFWSNVVVGLAIALLGIWEIFGREQK
jgi:VIT1/CCC1 family predicted Fe2+/Mn2+ transporter